MSEASVATGVPTSGGSGKSSPTAETVPVRMPPESVDGVVHLSPRRHDLDNPGGHRVCVATRALGDLAMRRGVEAEPLDRDLELMRADRPGGVEDVRGLRQEPGGETTRSAPTSSAISSTRLGLIFMNGR